MRIKLKTVAMTVVLYAATVLGAQAVTVNNLTFKDVDIKVVLQAISRLATSDGVDINIVPAPNVTGTVTIDLAQVDWETALTVILKTYNLDAYRKKNVILISPAGTGAAQEERVAVQVKVFTLKYVDANDVQKAILPILSSSGKTAVLETTGQSGWAFGTEVGKKSDASGSKLRRTKILIVSDSAERLDQIAVLVDQLDVMPKQILIKTRIMEVNHDLLRDLGIEWGTGATGAESAPLQAVDSVSKSFLMASHSLAPAPSTFLPQTTTLTTANGGLALMFKHISGTEYQAIMHALEENTKANTLSSPILMTLNNQEATILIGTKFPIIKTDVSTETSAIIGGSLQEYKDIGIQLNVVPQIWGEKENYINLIVHPAVSSYSTTAKVLGGVNGTTTLVEYPIISTREAETQLIVPDNGTVMMGGLLKDIKTKQTIGIPFLSKIPLLGALFRRQVDTTEKVELIIFITAHIMTPEEQVSPEIIDTAAMQREFRK